MNTPLHPMVVHFPMALAVLLPLISLGLLLAWWRGALPRHSWTLVCLLQVTLVASSVFALRTGEADEELVEQVVAESAIEEHEEAAELFTWGAGLLLAVSLLPLFLRDERRARGVALASVVGSLVVLGLGYRVGSAGGELVYKHGAAAAHMDGGATTAPRSPTWQHRPDDDDDDD